MPLENHSKDREKSDEARRRFVGSMQINYEKWHDGIGYDLAALDDVTEQDKEEIIEMLASNEDDSWRRFEALDYIGTPKALSIIEKSLEDKRLQVRIAAARFVRDSDEARERVFIQALEKSNLYEGLSQVLDQIENFHPPGIVDALFRGLLKRGDSAAVNFAGILFFIHGKADSSFDWGQRPLFLKFDTDDINVRKQAFIELCSKLEVDPKKYLNQLASEES